MFQGGVVWFVLLDHQTHPRVVSGAGTPPLAPPGRGSALCVFAGFRLIRMCRAAYLHCQFSKQTPIQLNELLHQPDGVPSGFLTAAIPIKDFQFILKKKNPMDGDLV